jgi:hypothetical protein
MHVIHPTSWEQTLQRRRGFDDTASRLEALRSILMLASGEEEVEVATQALLLLGAGRQEISTAMLPDFAS